MKLKHVLVCGVAFCLATTGADAAVINLIDKGGVTGSPAERGFRAAAHYWGSVLTNKVTINLGVEFKKLGGFAIGEASSTYQEYAIKDWEERIRLTRSSSGIDQAAILPTLNAQGGATFIINGADKNGDSDATKLTLATGDHVISRSLLAETAVLKAIGAIAAHGRALDAEIAFGSDFGVDIGFALDFDPTDGIDANAIDFLNVALHEIGHALGFVSGVDYLDYLSRPYGGKITPVSELNDMSLFGPLDMFRYSKDPANLVQGSQPVLDLSVDIASYFSIDGGKTALFGNGFATGRYNGDSTQASHWRATPATSDGPPCGEELGTMGRSCLGQMGTVTALDLAAFDAIGWNTSFDVLKNTGYRATTADIYRQFLSPVPEPTTWAMMLTGFAMVGGLLRGRRSRTTVEVDFAS